MNNETKDIDKPKFSGIYCIKNKVTDMVYIGLSKNIHNRWIEHKYRLNTHIHPNAKLQNAWDKYGEDNFEFIVLEKCDYDVIYEREKYWIKEYKSSEREFGYNLSTGGENTSEGSTWTNTQKENASKLRNPDKIIQIDIYGNIIKSWRSISHASRTLGLSNAIIKKCCEHKRSHCGNYLWFYSNDPLIHDKEYIKNHVMKNSRYFDIPIIQYDLYGNYIQKFSSFKDIQNKLNFDSVAEIRQCCRHNYNCSRGYIWLFELDDFQFTNEYLLKCRLLSETYELEQYDLNANYICTYNKHNLPKEYSLGTVIANCKNICNSAYGYIWKFRGDENKIITEDYIIKNNIFGKSKNVYAYSEDKVLIRKYNSMAEAVADGYTASYIRDCCNGKIKLYKNLFWSYREVC